MKKYLRIKKQKLKVTKNATITSGIILIGYLVILLTYMNYTLLPEIYTKAILTFFEATFYIMGLVLIFNGFQILVISSIFKFSGFLIEDTSVRLTKTQIKLFRFVFFFPDYSMLNFIFFILVSLSGFTTIPLLKITGMLVLVSAILTNSYKAEIQRNLAILSTYNYPHSTDEIMKIIIPNNKK